MEYNEYISLSKKDILNFISMVYPFTKTIITKIDFYVRVTCLNDKEVEFFYQQGNFKLRMIVENHSGKTVPQFYIFVESLRKITSSAYEKVLFVKKDDSFHTEVLGQLIYVDTDNFTDLNSNDTFNIPNNDGILTDKEVASKVFNDFQFVFTFSGYATDKCLVLHDGRCYYNTNSCVVSAPSPLNSKFDALIPSQFVTLLGALFKISEKDVIFHKVSSDDSKFLIFVADEGRIQLQIFYFDDIDDFFNDSVKGLLNFTQFSKIKDDTLYDLIKTISNFSYLSNVLVLDVNTNNLNINIFSNDLSKSSVYKYELIGDCPGSWEMRARVDMLKAILALDVKDIQYTFTEHGLGFQFDDICILLRKRI